jgi:hypothetical protein
LQPLRVGEGAVQIEAYAMYAVFAAHDAGEGVAQMLQLCKDAYISRQRW